MFRDHESESLYVRMSGGFGHVALILTVNLCTLATKIYMKRFETRNGHMWWFLQYYKQQN
jgi:hypothetical protein